MLCHCVERVIEHVGMHCGLDAEGEGAVSAGPDLLDLVVPGQVYCDGQLSC